MRKVLYIILVSLVLFGCQKTNSEQSGLSEQDEKNIHSFIEMHEKNILSSNWDADALLYADDAIRFPPGGGIPIKGIKAIQSDLKSVESVISYTHSIVDLNGGDDIAYFIAEYTFEGIPIGSTEPFNAKGRSVAILKRQSDNSWKFHRVMWN